MTVRLLPALLSLALAAPSALAPLTAQAVAPHLDPKCIQDKLDPYDLGWAVPEGPYQGKCLDSSRKRPAIVLQEDKDSITFANYFHEGRWWIARVPKDAVETTIFQIDSFKTPIPYVEAAHTQTRFKLKPGREIQLTSQSHASPSATAAVSDVIFSMEYASLPGVPYDLIKGELNEFAKVGRLISTRDRGMEQIQNGSTNIRQFQLTATPEMGSATLVEAIHHSHLHAMGDMYNTFRDNCATNAFYVLDRGMGYAGHVEPFHISLLFNALDPVAGPALRALQARKLIGPTSEIATLNAELGGKIPPPLPKAAAAACARDYAGLPRSGGE